MSSGGFQTVLISAPQEKVESSMLLKREPDSPPGYTIEQQTALQSIDADYNSNSFNFSYDGSFSLSPHQDMKDLEKSDTGGVSSQPLSNSGSSAPSPKSSFLAIRETKNDKMISGFDGRTDGLSPLSVIAVSAYQDAGNPSPNVHSSMLSSRTTHVLRFHPGGQHDTMLSTLNYTDTDLSGFDSGGNAFGTLDGLLGSSGTASMLLDQEAACYMETDLSPQAYSGDTFAVRENSPLAGIADSVKTDIKNKIAENTNATLVVDKLKVKGARPVKATSPSRPGTQPCPTCGKVFSNSSALTKHKLTHSDERKYVCQLCAKAFKRQDHLNGHMLTHRNKKPFECDAEGCGKSYCDARSLRRHKENHHSTTSSSSLTNQASVIPGLAQLGFNTLQTSFPASVITSAAGTAFSEANRIQYAPPPTTSASRPSAPSTSESTSRTTAATSHLQFLTFQQGHSMQSPSSSKGQQQSVSSPKSGSQAQSEGGMSSWQPQTINTGALLLAQNFGAQSQLINRNFEQQEQGNSSGSEMSQPQQKSEVLTQEQTNQLEQACFEVVDSTTGAKQLVALTSQGLQFESSQGTVVRLQDGDSVFSRATMQIVKMEPADSAPTTPTAKEPTTSQLSSPLLQQLLNQQSQEAANSRSEHPFMSMSDQHKQVSSQQSSVLMSAWSQVPFTGTTTVSTSRFNSQDPKPVECSLCQRKFKNIPALNGHMRLHGGYFKKENDAKKNEKKNNASHPPLQTASTNVRALIEEKINQKRNFLAPTTLPNNSHPPPQSFDFRLNQLTSNQQQNSSFIVQPITHSPIASPVVQDTPVFNHFSNPSQTSSSDLHSTDLNPSDLHSSNLHSSDLHSSDLHPADLHSSDLHPNDIHSPNLNPSDIQSLGDLNQEACDILKKLDLKSEQFRVPHPPQTEKHRRHSDSDHFIIPKRPCTTFTSSALADLLRNRVVAKRACRTGSDPGESLNLDAAFSELADSLIDLPKFLPPTSLDDSGVQDHKKFAVDDSVKEHSLHGMSLNLESIMPEDASALPVLTAEDIPEVQTYLPELDPQCQGVFFDGPHSTDLPEISVSELEMMQFASIVTSTANLPTDMRPVNGKGRTGDDSNDDDVFLSPTSLPTSPLKHKKKRRPEPIYIPPYVNTSHFHHSSRLRSPRLPNNKSLSPPPYTPPPMLSPVRSGSGLFWHILSGSAGSLTPKSAATPATPSFGLGRKASISESISETEEEYEEVPESDSVPHVNIGSNYQARIPPFNPHLKDAVMVKHKADKVWDPSTMDSLTDEEVEMYLELSCCAMVPGGGRNKEYALHLLQICKGNIKDAILSLMDFKPKLPPHHPLLTFQYSENDQWSLEEIEAYHQGLLKCDKDFFSIAKEIPGKSVKQCIQFYYLWKKVCPDEYKRIRFIRRRKEQESLMYNLRSKEDIAAVEDKRQRRNNSPSRGPRRNEDVAEKQHAVVNGSVSTSSKLSEVKTTISTSVPTTTYNGSGLSSTYDFTIEPLEEFPCKICGKVFSKVKSRSAHMKSHRQTDNDKKNRKNSLTITESRVSGRKKEPFHAAVTPAIINTPRRPPAIEGNPCGVNCF